MDCPIDIHASPRTLVPVSEQQTIEEFRRKTQEDIEGTKEHNSIPHLIHCHRLNNQQSTSHHPPSHQVPHFIPEFVGYSPYVHITTPLSPTNVHHIPLPLPFLPEEVPPLMLTPVIHMPIVIGTIPPMNYMAGGLWFFVNDINNIATSGVMTPLQVLLGAPPIILNTFNYMNMIASNAIDASGASTSNGAAQYGGVAFQGPHSPLEALQLSFPLMANNSGSTSTGIIEVDHILPEIIETYNSIHAQCAANANDGIDLEAIIGAKDGQQQHQEEETTAGQDPNLRCSHWHGSLDGSAVAATTIGQANYDINCIEIEMNNDSWMDKFWKEIMMDDLTPLPDASSTSELLPLASDMPDLKRYGHKPYLLDDIVSNASTNSICS